MEKRGPDGITLTYDFLKWAIPTLKKFPRDQRHFQDAGKQLYDKDGTSLPSRALHNGRQQNKPSRQCPNPTPGSSFFLPHGQGWLFQTPCPGVQ